MRKLIFGGIVFVLAMVVWKLYLDYETRQFIQNLPKLPESELQQLDSIPGTVKTTPLTTEPDDTEVELLNDLVSDTSASATMEIASTTATDLISEFENGFIEEGPAPDNTGLSPELKTLFSEYYPLHQELVEVSKVLTPMLERHRLGSRRIRDILLNELPGSTDGPERQALHAEIDEIHAWKNKVKRITMELQNKREQLYDESSILFAKYGISSWQEFNRIHGDAYNAWKSEQ
ncbi:hypothetical protein F4009_16845 [Candidatus Poribacteria bacterium]|nr:hypothetical protein [Candidatus Poribacteria bacterium]MYH81978.1 hypothetical protein [Candidatus Poribacteria bacterium]MYK95639.1 hypothetical protein [Candidatus Poribacteria bacterium]